MIHPSFPAGVRPPLFPLEAVGGAVSLQSPFYVERAVDQELKDEISKGEGVILIKGARQIGKTSLLARGLEYARQTGKGVVLTDFQKLNTADLKDLPSFYRALASSLAAQLDLDEDLTDHWDDRLSPNRNFERFVKEAVLGDRQQPLVWAMDEADRLIVSSLASEVFSLMRAWYNERALDVQGPWSKLQWIVSYATEGHLFITDLNLSPFNVGKKLDIQDLTRAQVADLNDRYGSPLKSEVDLDAFYDWVGGQPYLVRRSLHELVLNPSLWAKFGEAAGRSDGIFSDHLKRIVLLLSKNRPLLEALRRVLDGGAQPDEHQLHCLQSGGVMVPGRGGEMRLRNRLYEGYFSRHLG